MADHPHRGPAHLPHPADRRPGQPGLVGRGHLRRVAHRRAGLDDPGRRLVGRRRRRRPPALASRALGGRAPDGPRLAGHDARRPARWRPPSLGVWRWLAMKRGRWFLPETPDVLGLLRAQVAVTIEGIDAFAAWAAATRPPPPTVRDAEHRGDARQARAARRAARRVRHAARARGPLRALARHRLGPQLRRGPRRRVGGHGLPPDAAHRRDGRAARPRRCATSTRRSRSSGSDGDAADGRADAAISGRARARAALLPAAWRRCSRSTTCASGSRAASSTAAARGSARAVRGRRRARHLRGRQAELSADTAVATNLGAAERLRAHHSARPAG